VEFLRGLSERHVVAVGSLLSTLGIARSPASALAVIKECEGNGPFCTHILSTTVLKDVLVVALFAINVELVALSGLDFHKIVLDALEKSSVDDVSTVATTDATALGDTTGAAARRLLVALKPATQFERSHIITKLLQPLIRVAGAVAAGIVAGVLLGRILKVNFALSRWKNIRMGCVFAFAAMVFISSEHVGLEPLLVCVTMGLTAANRKHANGDREREELRVIMTIMMPGVNLLFFTLAGASLKLENAYNSLVIATGLVIVRLVALYCATAISARILKTPMVSAITGERRRNIEWMGHVTQAGVALGLSRTVAARFPYWGPAFSTLAVSIIVINLLIGPVLFRTAIELMNESNSTLHAALDRVSRPPQIVDDAATSPRESKT
jgi:Kef-type K+ transport system membrane component KefB